MARERKNSENRSRLSMAWLRVGALLLVFLIVSVLFLMMGMRSAQKQDKLFWFVQKVRNGFSPPKSNPAPFQCNHFGQLIFYPNKIEVLRPEMTKKTIVAFVFGQSNSANHGGEKYQAASEKITNYFNGKFYVATDPLLGASGLSGSVWTLTANKLVSQGVADRVILIPAGTDGTSVKAWKRGGKLNGMLERKLMEAKSNHLPVTHFLWHQGENDNPANPDSNKLSLMEYEKGLMEIIQLTKQYFPASKFFVARASRCGFMAPSPELQKVQSSLASMENVYLGPNTDMIDYNDRYDDCHLSARGLEKHSNDWVLAIKKQNKSK